MLPGKPPARLNLFGVESEGPFGFSAIDPDEFLAGFLAGLESENAGGSNGKGDAEFLLDFTEGAGVVVLAAIEMARGRGIPGAGEGVLGLGTLLEENVATLIINEDVDGAMAEPLAMNLGAGETPDDLVVFVDDIKYFFGHVSGGRGFE